MTPDLIWLRIWLGTMVVLIVTSLLYRQARGSKIPSSQDFFVAACTLGGVITMVRVFITVFTEPDIQTALDWDGTIATCASSLWIAFFGVKEIVKLF
jgi:hypothetical protein